MSLSGCALRPPGRGQRPRQLTQLPSSTRKATTRLANGDLAYKGGNPSYWAHSLFYSERTATSTNSAHNMSYQVSARGLLWACPALHGASFAVRAYTITNAHLLRCLSSCRCRRHCRSCPSGPAAAAAPAAACRRHPPPPCCIRHL
jgi:hypothetical protein